jgi:hypothetical protein
MLGAFLGGDPMAARIFLGLSALIWLPYGVLCFFQPAGLAESAGVTFTSPTGATEIRAMYGGLQAAIGAVALGGALRPALSGSALALLLVACAGLGGARLLGAGLDGEISSYTGMALGLELGTVALTAWLLRRAAAPAA